MLNYLDTNHRRKIIEINKDKFIKFNATLGANKNRLIGQ